MKDYIQGGYILLPRNILFSDIWKKPAAYLKIFIYILLKVNHSNGLFDRGSNFFNFSNETLPWVTKNQIYDFLRWAKSNKIQILTTEKTTRGVVLKINNYNKYQTSSNYEIQHNFQDNSKTAPKQFQNSSNTINNNKRRKEEKNVYIPTEKEILDYVHSLCKEINVDDFISYYESVNWLDNNGLTINWKQKAITWANNYKQSSEINSVSNSGQRENVQEVLAQWALEGDEV